MGDVPMAGSTVNFIEYQSAATPAQIVPRKKQITYVVSASMPIVRARSGLTRVALIRLRAAE